MDKAKTFILVHVFLGPNRILLHGLLLAYTREVILTHLVMRMLEMTAIHRDSNNDSRDTNHQESDNSHRVISSSSGSENLSDDVGEDRDIGKDFAIRNACTRTAFQ